jgi:hypothetical protein
LRRPGAAVIFEQMILGISDLSSRRKPTVRARPCGRITSSPQLVRMASSPDGTVV